MLFGGVVSERMRPRRDWDPSKAWLRVPLLILAFGLLPFTAESYAIAGALGVNLDSFDAWIVVIAVVFSTLALSAALLAPWIERAWTVRRDRLPILSLAVLSVVLAWFVASMLKGAIDNAALLAKARSLGELLPAADTFDESDQIAVLNAEETRLRAQKESGAVSTAKYRRELMRLANERVTLAQQQADDHQRLRSADLEAKIALLDLD